MTGSLINREDIIEIKVTLFELVFIFMAHCHIRFSSISCM
jgi:hypothetical protein